MSAPNKIDITYYKHAWPLREKKENGEIVDTKRSENIIKHYTEIGKAAFDGSSTRNDGTQSANGNDGFPLYKDDIDTDGKPTNTSIMRDDSFDYDYLYYINRYPDIATLPPREAKEHWTNFGQSNDDNPRKGRDLIKATVDTTTITLKMPEIRQPKVRVILSTELSVDTTYTLVIERPDNFGDAYLLSGDEIEILFKYTETTTGQTYAVVQTNNSVTETQFHVELDVVDGNNYLLNTAPTKTTKSGSGNYVYQYVKLYYIEDGTQDGADGFWSTRGSQRGVHNLNLIDDGTANSGIITGFKQLQGATDKSCQFKYFDIGLFYYGFHKPALGISAKEFELPSSGKAAILYVSKFGSTDTNISFTGSHITPHVWGTTHVPPGAIEVDCDKRELDRSTNPGHTYRLDMELFDLIEASKLLYGFGVIDLHELRHDAPYSHYLIEITKMMDDHIELHINGDFLGGGQEDDSTPQNFFKRFVLVPGRYMYYKFYMVTETVNIQNNEQTINEGFKLIFSVKQAWNST